MLKKQQKTQFNTTPYIYIIPNIQSRKSKWLTIKFKILMKKNWQKLKFANFVKKFGYIQFKKLSLW